MYCWKVFFLFLLFLNWQLFLSLWKCLLDQKKFAFSRSKINNLNSLTHARAKVKSFLQHLAVLGWWNPEVLAWIYYFAFELRLILSKGSQNSSWYFAAQSGAYTYLQYRGMQHYVNFREGGFQKDCSSLWTFQTIKACLGTGCTEEGAFWKPVFFRLGLWQRNQPKIEARTEWLCFWKNTK